MQWWNITHELTTCVFNFSCHETHTLLTQTAWQVDSFSKGEVCWESHTNLEEEKFENSLLSALNNAVRMIKGNWQGAVAACTFVTLATWLFSLSTCNVVHDSCSCFLWRAWAISLHWTHELGLKLQEGQREEKLKILNAQTLKMILTCYETFNVDPHHLPYLLKLDEDIAVVIKCSIIMHNQCSVIIDDLPASINTLLWRHWRLSYILEPLLCKWILEVHTSLDSTVSQLWAGYAPGSS